MPDRNSSRGAPAVDVLISNAWGRTPYNVTRSLGRRDLRVAVGTDRFLGMAALSRFAAATFRHPLATTDAEGFVESVKGAIQRYSPRVYLPMGEDTYVAAKYLDELQSTGVEVPVAPYSTIRRLHRKDAAIALARSLGIPVPATIVPTNADELRAFCHDHGPLFVSKRTSSSSARGVSYLTEADLTAAFNVRQQIDAAPLTDCVVQQYVHGTGYGVSMLFNRGQLRAKFTHKRLKETPATGGTSVLRVGVVHPELEDYAQRLLESVGFHGVAMVEFKHNEATGESWLLEVNPRFWGSLALAMRSGVDFPYLLFRMATEGDIEPVCDYRNGVVLKWFLGNLGTVTRRFNRAALSQVRERARPDGYDDLCWDDPTALLGGGVLAFWKLLATRSWQHDQLTLSLDKLDSLERFSPVRSGGASAPPGILDGVASPTHE